jgi:hypothetical protein
MMEAITSKAREPSPHFLRWCALALFALFCLSVSLKLNGSSVGMWRNLLMEPGIARGLLFSSPKRVRVDEWAFWTPSMLSQARQTPPFPIENPNLGAGRAPLIMNMPVRYYTTLFRPQFWGFFIFDFERGFSFYWCCKVFGLLLATGWLFQQMGVRSRALVLFGAIWIFFSSYVQWWFSTPAMLPEMLASWAVCIGCAIRFFREKNRGRILFALAGFVFFAINFVLCLYPPYQIPLLILAAAILIGVCLEQQRAGECAFSLHRGALLIAVGVVTVILILIPFWIDVRSTLTLVAHTVYPGARRSSGGDLSLFKLFSGVIGFFETEQIGPRIYDNIVEASNFYPLWPAAFLALALHGFRTRTCAQPLFISLAATLFFFSAYCVLPLPAWLTHATLLNFCTESRALLALGIANVIFCCLFFDRYRDRLLPNAAAWSAGLICWCGACSLLIWLNAIDPKFFADWFQFALPLVINSVLLAFFFWESIRRWLPPLLAALLISGNASINPLMRGLSPLLDSAAFKTVDRLRKIDPEGKWMVFHTRYFAQLVKATGVPIFNGTKVVPDLTFLHQLDPGGTNEFTYNRYANIVCELPRNGEPIDGGLVYPDFYILFLRPDLPLFQNAGYRYVLFPNEWKSARAYGFGFVEKVGASNLWIYRLSPVSIYR